MEQKTLDTNQQYVVDRLTRYGSHITAASAKKNWENGESFYLDTRHFCRNRGLIRLINQGNKVATTEKTNA